MRVTPAIMLPAPHWNSVLESKRQSRVRKLTLFLYYLSILFFQIIIDISVRIIFVKNNLKSN